MQKTIPSSGHFSNGRSGAFTLVELLVVVAIIAVLLAALVPALASAKSKSKMTACGANLRQMGLASLTYIQSNDGVMCPGSATIIAPAGQINWEYYLDPTGTTYSFSGYLSPFLLSQKILICPELPIDTNNSNTGTIPCGYGLNLNTPPHADALKDPQETVVFSDTVSVTAALTLSCFNQQQRPSGDTSTAGRFHGRHPGHVGQVVFYDGHVEAIAPQLRPIVSLSSSTNWFRNSPNNVGSLCFGTIDPVLGNVTSSNFTTYANTYNIDYYFWIDKDAKK